MAALTHTQNVTRLYRKSLKHLLSWAIDRRLWRRQALELRDRFDANKDVDHSQALRLLQEGEAEFERRKHPDPYICNKYTCTYTYCMYVLISVLNGALLCTWALC